MLSFLKLGLIGFGGGVALLPVFERELVDNRKWVDKRQFDLSAIIASLSPASLPVALCTVWNIRYALVSAFAFALPGALIYLILLTGFSVVGEVGTKYLQFVSVGFIAFVLFLLYRFVRKSYLASAQTGLKTRHLLVMAAAFLLSGGSVLRRLASMLFGFEFSPAFLAVNMLTLMIMTFFIIIVMGSSKSKIRLLGAVALAGFYALTNGKAAILHEWSVPILIVMLIVAAGSILSDLIKNKALIFKANCFKADFKPLLKLLLFVVMAAVLVSTIYIVCGDTNVWDYAGKVVTSSLTSFGGGEVYIGISETTFVQTGFISEQAYNTQIIGIANTLPGPILVSIVTGVGYIYGSTAHGLGFGWLFGFLGLVLAVAVTAVGALTLAVFFEILKDSRRLRLIIQYIMPVVCGMLVSTAISLLIQASSVLVGIGINVFICFIIVLTVFFIVLILHKRFRLNDLLLLLLSGGATVAVLSIMQGV